MIKAVETIGPKEARERLTALKGWTLQGKALRLELALRDFPAAIAFIHEVAQLAESADHHPDLHLTGYRNLAIELTSHDAGGLTPRDFALAAEIDDLPRQLKKEKRR
ncbi:MAG: 4a-hydroxytetrahydrobiopterin dehydratase [Elusimicrobiota bacterium]|nr:MAG: 4a-hydroxytetrahydrobiopterin dehydratase [Elusimicrobiota bacterium]